MGAPVTNNTSEDDERPCHIGHQRRPWARRIGTSLRAAVVKWVTVRAMRD